MKHTISVSLFCIISTMIHASQEQQDDIKKIKTEYTVVIENILTQSRDKLIAGEDITDIEWLASKNKTEFKEIKCLISDLNIMINFDRQIKKEIQEELKKILHNTINNELDKVCVIKDVKADMVNDFLYISGLACGLTLESAEECFQMIDIFKKENRVFLKKIKIVEKANNKIKETERRAEKKDKKRKLYEHIVLGAIPRKI